MFQALLLASALSQYHLQEEFARHEERTERKWCLAANLVDLAAIEAAGWG